MIKLGLIFGAVIGVLGLLVVVSVLGGTIVWLCWDSLLSAFPGLNDFVVQDLGWWDSVKLAFLFGALIKTAQTNNSK